LILWLNAPDAAQPPVAGSVPLWEVATKADIGQTQGRFSISSQTGTGIGELMVALESYAADAGGLGEPALVSRERDVEALMTAASSLEQVATQLAEPELAAESLRQASHALERLLGRMDAESVLDRLFMSFCIGK
jgi:tRNA modification GTPase